MPITGDNIDDVDLLSRPNVTAHVDVVIETNAPPRGHPLEIVPLHGIAVRTVFKFTTGTALDEPIDYPLRYTFQFLVAMRDTADTVFVSTEIGQYYENTVCDSWLPYSAQPIQTVYEVCDSRESCARYFGPNVTVELSTDTASETDDKMLAIDDDIAAAMERMDYEEAFRVANITAITLRNGGYDESSQRLAKFRIAQRTRIAKQCERLTQLLSSSATANDPKDTSIVFVSAKDAAKFVALAGQTLTVMSYGATAAVDAAADATVLKQFLQLLDLVDRQNAVDDSQPERRRRRTRAAASSLSTAGNARSTNSIHERLQTIEGLLQSSTGPELQQIKRNLTRTVHEFMLSLCKKTPFPPKSFSELNNTSFPELYC